ncbi:MAG: ZIP family metal transporter [Betaproteobacteria bacterium]|nr:MAG: ZIP family metal transporter [Betaproteobacteria bacterium]TAG50208.1 MAG: ZIP family metal transporter [Betaproteobacteria bacterium]
MTLFYIILATTFGGVASIAVASFALWAKLASIERWVAFAVGAMLTVVFLDILPHALSDGVVPSSLMAWVLAGVLFFFFLEKLVIWRHSHGDLTPPPGDGTAAADAHHTHHHHHHHHAHGHGHGNDKGRTGLMILIGDSLHNATDGVVIAAAFMADFKLGVVTSLAVIAHEIPQEVSDFFVLLHSGYSRRKAFLYNLLSSLAMVVGGVIAYFALDQAQAYITPVLAFAAASMLYVAVADLIPTLHRRFSIRDTLQQMVMIGLGVVTVVVMHSFLH